MKKIASILSSLFILLIVFIYSCGSESSYYDEIDLSCIEETHYTDSANYFTRSWRDYNESFFCTNYVTHDSLTRISKQDRLRFTPFNSWEYYEFWGNLYTHLYYTNQDKILGLTDSLQQIQLNEHLSRDEFANLIVSFVQDIPYSYVLSSECATLKDKSFPCVDNIEYGILSPYEFLHTLSGDCDTRTVLLFTILKQFNYSPCIVVSLNYAHSMLLLDVATAGDYIYKYGRKYYFWETTATGWEAGMIPPDMRDLKYWEIVLD